MNNPDHISERLETIFCAKILKFFGSGIEKFRSGINIHPRSTILGRKRSIGLGARRIGYIVKKIRFRMGRIRYGKW
jgi:hypothetical protein